MTTTISFLVSLTALTSSLAYADQSDDMDVVKMESVPMPTSDEFKRRVVQQLNRRPPNTRFSSFAEGEEETVSVDKIINLGKRVWKVIEDGKPVVSIQYHYANALPKGVRDASTLSGFSALQFYSFRESGHNLFGTKVYDVVYTVAFRFGGSYEGNGQYLDAVAIVPQKVEAAWMYNVSFAVNDVAVSNVGSMRDPVAAMVLESTFKVSTAVKEYQARGLFDLRGDSSLIGYSTAH